MGLSDMENDLLEDDMDIEVTSMWPKDINEDGSQFNVEKPSEGQDTLKQVALTVEPAEVDHQRLLELTSHSEKGASQLAFLVKHWEYRQANAVRLLKEELDNLSKQRQEVELKKLEILEEHRFDEEVYHGDKRSVSILSDLYDLHQAVPKKKDDTPVHSNRLEIDAEYDTVSYWRQKAMVLEKMLEDSMHREQVLMEKLQESINNMEAQSTPVEELSQMLKRADNFIHFILQNAPIVLGHMDKELRYRFIYNHFPSFKEEDLIGKTDTEIFSGVGVQESLDFKREVLERGLPGKREITFETELFGLKTFLIYVEPVFNKAGETIGVNYIGMDITDQVRKREKMAKLREEIAVQKAMETELNKTIHITEETMRAKQMLATMSHEIRSPLSGVVSMAEILSTTNLDRDQRQLLNVMISSGDLVLQLINDILDLSKVESGVMKLESTKFRPREVVKHVLQTAAASLRKMLTLEGHVAEDIPVEVELQKVGISHGLSSASLEPGVSSATTSFVSQDKGMVVGDVLRIRQILTNLVSNAIKFTQEGKVGIKLHVVSEPIPDNMEQSSAEPQGKFEEKVFCGEKRYLGVPGQDHTTGTEPKTPKREEELMNGDEEKHNYQLETVVWIRCDVYDTGIGIPENALPTLFKHYMQVSADHARKYGGTGLGLAICKQLVELMGGHLTVSSKEHCGSTFTFVLPYRVSPVCEEQSDDPDELPDELPDIPDKDGAAEEATAVYFNFQPPTLGPLFSAGGPVRNHNMLQTELGYKMFPDLSAVGDSLYTFPSSTLTLSVEAAHDPPPPNQVSSSSNVGDKCEMEEEGVQTSKPQSDASEQPRRPKILLVEDNKINVMVTRNMMSKLGHSIDVVNNGVEAVRAVQRQSYDLVLMDVCMPVMDGLQATRIIRAYEDTGRWDAAVEAGIDAPFHSQHTYHDASSTKRLAIIAMTANALSESAEECYANGMDSFVSKPVTFQKLTQCLEQYLPLL